MDRITTIFPKLATLAGFFVLLFSLAVACTPTDAQLVEGILENVDTANGEITIVTKDGKTVTLSISTDDAENADGSTTLVSALYPGVPLEIEATERGGRQVARRVKTRQAEVEGTIVGIDGQEIAIESSDGEVTVVVLGDDTQIELGEDAPGTLAGLAVGLEVEAKFDPDSRAAFKLESEGEGDEGDEGDEGEVADNADGSTTLSSAPNPGVVPGIEATEGDGGQVARLTEARQAEVKGTIVGIDGHEIAIESSDGEVTVVVLGDNTRIELGEDAPGTLAGLAVGLEVEAKFDPDSRAAFKLKSEGEHEEDDEDGEDEGDDD